MASETTKRLMARYLVERCEFCGAGEGEWCVTASGSGKEAQWIHLARREALRDTAGR